MVKPAKKVLNRPFLIHVRTVIRVQYAVVTHTVDDQSQERVKVSNSPMLKASHLLVMTVGEVVEKIRDTRTMRML